MVLLLYLCSATSIRHRRVIGIEPAPRSHFLNRNNSRCLELVRSILGAAPEVLYVRLQVVDTAQ